MSYAAWKQIINVILEMLIQNDGFQKLVRSTCKVLTFRIEKELFI